MLQLRNVVTILIVVLCAGGCGRVSLEGATWEPLSTGSAASLRGLCALDDGVVWASGTDGTVLRSVNGGASWDVLRVPGDSNTDVRDVEALDANTAWAMCITEPARILKTTDGGASWREVHRGKDGAFFDSIALWRHRQTVDGECEAVVFGDPVDGRFDISRSVNGDNWRVAVTRPLAAEGEAAFAASGTCVVTAGYASAWIGTGGARARVLRSRDFGVSWDAFDTPIRQGGETTGIYSVAFANDRHGCVVGGDYTEPERGGANAAITKDGGCTWNLSAEPPRGYRSCVVYVPGSRNRTLIAVGRAGCDWSDDGGETWKPLGGDDGFYAVAVSPDGSVYAAGSDGRVSRLRLRSGR